MSTDDFVSVPVPKDSRQSIWAVAAVWLGFIIVVGTMAAGGGLAAQAKFSDILIGILVGNIVLGAFALLSGWIGAKSGMSFYQLGEKVFGSPSMRLVGLYVPIILIGWFGIESAILGGFLGKVLGLSEALQRTMMFVSAGVMATSAYFGFKALKNLSYILLPIIFALGAFAIFQTDLGGLEARQVFSGEPMGFLYVAGIVVSTWIMGVLLNFPDVARFARTPLQGALVGFFGILLGNVFNLLIGAIAAINTGAFDPSEILFGLGFVPLAILLAVSNIWTTNDNNLYSATLGASRSLRIPRYAAVIICGGIGAVFAAFNPATIGSIFTVLIAVGSTAPALGGVVLGAYVVREMMGTEKVMPIVAWAGWILGSIAGVYLGDFLGILVGFIVGFVCVAVGYYTEERYR